MTPTNLVLTFTLAGDSRVHVRGASRIKVDGRGGLTLFDAEKGGSEMVSLDCLRSLIIQTVPGMSTQPAGIIQ
ncbi:MAG: hypothetical protein JWO19_2357 [Bryobacterales bacterium]|jgi:hypothetical protein|nr:hypothetical protein [Bryobacterales bacterium]